MVGAELVAEAENAVGAGFRGVEIVFGTFEDGEVFDGEVFWKAFDRKAGKIVGHSMEGYGETLRAFIDV